MPDGPAAAPASAAASEAAVLALTQWLSPAFPIGAFAYSHGLERAIAAGDVRDADSLQRWLAALVSCGSARTDAILLAQALRPGADWPELSGLAVALAASSEREQEMLEQGSAFVRTVNVLLAVELPSLAYPVAVGAAARTLGLPIRMVLALFLQGFVANLITVGVRFIPLGQTEGQIVLASLQPLVAAVAKSTGSAPLGDLGTAALRSDLAAMHHETMSPRMFRT